jgi:hypothetical protein
MALDVQIKGANKLREMAIQLRLADKQVLGRELNKAIKDAATPTLKDIRDSAESLKTTGVRKPGAKHPFTKVMPPKGLRHKVAESVEAQVSVFAENPRVRFRTGKGLPPELANMPRNLDSPGTFRHPVMGNREVWVSQRGDPWFWKPIERNLGTFRGEIDKALDRTREFLERG